MFNRVRKHISASDLRRLNEDLTLKFRDKLNPVFWGPSGLKSIVREKLMDFGKAFADYAEIPEEGIVDILMLGGNAGYNYTKYSDIDVHLVVDPKYVPDCDPDFLDDYYMDKKTLWELTHDVKIYGVQAEPYIERPGITRKQSQGVYSLLKNRFIQEPQKFEGELDEKELEKKTNNIKSKIERLVDSDNGVGLRAIMKKLRAARQASLDSYGEYGFENLVFKELRNSGYIDKIRDAMLQLNSRNLSLT